MELKCPSVDGFLCFDLMVDAVQSIKGPSGEPYYSLWKTYEHFNLETNVDEHLWFNVIDRRYPTFKLAAEYTAF